MGVSGVRGEELSAGDAGDTSAEVAWHDIECGDYTADLSLWHELAADTRRHDGDGAILDIGAGTGRVALALACAGHRVTALDSDAQLLHELERRARGRLETVCADARAFTLERRDFALCVVPMQTVQLLGGARGRRSFLRCVRAHLAHDGLLAIAIITEFEPFDCCAGDAGPDAERTRRNGRVYVSRATRVRRRVRSTLIERERYVLSGPGGRELSREHDMVALDNLSAEQLEREGAAAGFAVAPRRSVAATAEHVGSVVVVLAA